MLNFLYRSQAFRALILHQVRNRISFAPIILCILQADYNCIVFLQQMRKVPELTDSREITSD